MANPRVEAPPASKKARKNRAASPSTGGKPSGTDVRSSIVPSPEEGGNPWPWRTLVGSFAVDHAPAFTKDGRYLFIIAGPSVKMYSVSTGQVVGTLQSPSGNSASHSTGRGEDIITAVSSHPYNPFQLITGSLDGSIRIWDFLDAKLLHTINVGYPISHLCSHEKFKEQVFVAVVTKMKKNRADRTSGHSLVLLVSLKTKGEATESSASKSSEIVRIGKTRVASSLAISRSGSWLGVVAGLNLYVASTSALDNGFIKHEAPQAMTCLAIHPNDEYIVTGDEKGQLRFWYCLSTSVPVFASGSNAQTKTSTLHWHAHAVSSVIFTPNGAQLLSGGEEGVLVLWHMHTGRREFVPNLGAAIKSIAIRNTGQEEYLVGLVDGGFILVNGDTLTKTRAVSHISIAPVSHQRYGSSKAIPLAVHSASSTVILPASHPSSLQFYRSATWTVTSELDVVPSNHIARRDEKPLNPPRVERVATSASGEWMATIDIREGDEDDDLLTDVHIKIWHWENSAWVLNSRIDQPHGQSTITALSFSPVRLRRVGWLLMSAGLDGKVKTWRTESTAPDKQTENWTGNSVLSYRSLKPLDAAWTPDASLLAVAFGGQVILYSATTHAILDTLVCVDVKNIEFLRVVGRGRFLLVADYKDAVLWDLVTRRIRWHYHSPLRIMHVVPHPKNDVVTLLLHSFKEDKKQRDTHALVFGVASAAPLETRRLPFWLRGVAWFPSSRSQFALVGITHTWTVVLISEDASEAQEQSMLPRDVVAGLDEQPRRSLFQDIFGDSAFEGISMVPQPTVPPTFQTNWESAPIFDCAAHLAPALESIYSPLMDSFLHRRPVQTDAPEPKEDVEMEDGNLPPLPSHQPILLSKKIVDDKDFNTFVDLFKNHMAITNSQSLPYFR